MDTNQTTIGRDALNLFLAAWYEEPGNLMSIAARLGMTLLDLAEFAMQPAVVAAVDAIDAIARRRADSLALSLRNDAIMRLDTIVHTTKAETPRDREAVRKAANDIVKASNLPPDFAYRKFAGARQRVEEVLKTRVELEPAAQAASSLPNQRMPRAA